MREKTNMVRLTIVLLCLASVLVQGCSKQTPKIIPFVQVTTIGEIGALKFDQIIKSSGIPPERIRVLNVKINMEDSKGLKERKIVIPNVVGVLDHFDKARVLTGGEFEQNNVESENWAEVSKWVLFDYTGLDDQTLRKMFNSSMMQTSLRFEDGQVQETKYSIGELMVFKDEK